MTKEEKSSFFTKIGSAVSSAEILKLLGELHAGEARDFTEQEIITHTLTALSSLRRQSKVEGVWPRTAFLAYGLPVSLKASEEEQARFELYSLRELLGEWINELPTVLAVSLFEECYSFLLPRLESVEGELLRVTCWLIGDLGYRTDTLVEALERIVRDNSDYTGDVALGTLVGLGNVGARRERYLADARERATSRYNNSLDFVFSTLIDATTINFVASNWIPPESSEPPDMEKVGGAITILGRIAKHTRDQQLQNRILDLFKECQRRFARYLEFTFVIRGDILTNCDSEGVIPFLYSLSAIEVASDPKHEAALRLSSLRILGAVLPHQLLGCDAEPPDHMLSRMRNLLLQSEEYSGRSLTHLNHLKEHVLDTLFKLGRPEIIGWFGDVLNAQKNPYAKSELLRLLACFSLRSFPAEIPSLISDVRELKPEANEPELLVRLAAGRLVRSAGTWEAFTMLLRPGLTFNNSVMLDTVEALADVSLSLCDRGERKQEVIDALLQNLAGASDPVTSSACRALNALALAGHLDPQYIEPISEWIKQPSPANRAFVKGLMIQALGVYQESQLPGEIVHLLERWARENNDWLGWRSIETLIRVRATLPADILIQLGLINRDGEWFWDETKSSSIWSATFVVLLSEKRTTEFVNAVANAVLAENWEASDRTVMGLVALQRRTGKPMPKCVGEALIEKAKRRNRPNSADTAVISYLPKLCPAEFSAEPWAAVWPNWTDDAKAELARALGELKAPFVPDSIVKWLSLLVKDAHFGVRRSAARSLSKVASSIFFALVHQAASSDLVEDRLRACEFLPWLETSNDAGALAEKLSADAFSSIRELVEKCQEEREKLQLARQYLRTIAAQVEWTNETVRSLSRYGQALSNLGDDETLEGIDLFLSRTDLPSHVRYWAIGVSKDVETSWRGKKQKWPQPLSDAKGTIQTGLGRIKWETFEAPVEFKLWCEVSSNLGEQLTWGGSALLRDLTASDKLLGPDRILILEDGREFKVGIFGTLTVQNRIHIDFQGIGDYPGLISSR